MSEPGRRRIFVVDDETMIANTLAVILNSHGFDAVAFTDPLEALYAGEVHCPDLLLTDVMMPQLNGVDLGVQFKAIHPECKVLLFSGAQRTVELMADAKLAGHSFNLLSKPVHPRDLIATINDIMSA
ncbi:MAG TPA: response regulator [Acidobacteriaceae bacterium]|nr:response regulator [Acidobacteriaceae bacterium]